MIERDKDIDVDIINYTREELLAEYNRLRKKRKKGHDSKVRLIQIDRILLGMQYIDERKDGKKAREVVDNGTY